MEETENLQKKLPNQEVDYFKIGKILISRWYWVAGSLAVFVLWSYIYVWYTPKTFATGGIMKLEEKKSEIADLSNVLATSDRGPSRIQSETSVLSSDSFATHSDCPVLANSDQDWAIIESGARGGTRTPMRLGTGF